MHASADKLLCFYHSDVSPFDSRVSCRFSLSNLPAQESAGHSRTVQCTQRVFDNEIRCIACNVGIDGEVPRTQPSQVKHLIQHYEVQLVALIARDRGFGGFAVRKDDSIV
jgi:hypothetical protein